MAARIRSRYSLAITALLAAAAMAMVAPGRAQERAGPPDTGSDPRIENPAAGPSGESETDLNALYPEHPEDQQRDLAVKIFPSLLELGLDVVPGDDQVQSVLSAINLLRRLDTQAPFSRLDDDVAAYVDQKVAAYRAARILTIRIQGALDALGFAPGPIDGVYGPLTTEGVRRYQRSVGMPPTGTLTAEQVDALEMKSIDKIMQPAEAKAPPDATSPDATAPNANAASQSTPTRGDTGSVVVTPAKAPEIDPDVLDYIGR